MSDRPTNEDDATGFNVAPSRYSAQGRETIDRIRDQVGRAFIRALERGLSVHDASFVAYCEGCIIKYSDRLGLKGDASEDALKAAWYTLMRDHALGLGPDPRTYRANFQPYQRPE